MIATAYDQLPSGRIRRADLVDLLEPEIAQLRAAIQQIQPVTNVAAPNVTHSPHIVAQSGPVHVTADVHHPPPRKRKIRVTMNDDGSADAEVSEGADEDKGEGKE